MMSEKVDAAVIPPSYGKMLLNIFDEFVAVAGNDKLSIFKGVVFKNRFSYSATVVVVDGIDSVIENNEWACNAPRLRQQNGETKAANMALAQDMQCIYPAFRGTPK